MRFILAIILISTGLNAQDQPPSLEWGGYVKSLQSLIFFDQSSQITDDLLMDNLLHHRLNFKYFANNSLSLNIGMRNQLITGDLVRLDPTYSENLDQVNDYFDFSWSWEIRDGMIWNTSIDRLYFEFSTDQWEIRGGRQRINWGINTYWNPNDIFNAYSFIDFDYEERPGSDALRVRYFPSSGTSIELASNIFDHLEEANFGFMWRFNKNTYDFQLISAYSQKQIVLGGGWAGNLKELGFKGEFSYFLGTGEDIHNSFTLSAGLEHVFSNGLFFGSGILYGSEGTNGKASNTFYDFNLSANLLYPYRYNTYVNLAYNFTPLLNGSFLNIYSPSEAHALLIFPTLTYSIADNWDLDFVGQILFEKDDQYRSNLKAFFLRIKWSY